MKTVHKYFEFVLMFSFAFGSILKGGNDRIRVEPGHVKQDFETVEEVRGLNRDIDKAERADVNDDVIKEGILDVGYYLRRFKFNGFDPRYLFRGKIQKNMFTGFPSPPLKNLDWEVRKNCETSFTKCLMYLQKKVNGMVLPRHLDSLTMVNRNGWSFPSDEKAIKSADSNCRSLLKKDEDTFGQLPKFKWLTSASYYMCLYTMKEIDYLETFADDCDNFASCIEWEGDTHNGDFRGNNRLPFACALYSFCPDPCCPVKYAQNRTFCLETGPPLERVTVTETCRFLRKGNLDLESITLNRWNVSCECGQTGMRWDSQSGTCIDVDECVESQNPCHFLSETCINLRGGYKCICNQMGYRKNPETKECEVDPNLRSIFYPRRPSARNNTELFSGNFFKLIGKLKLMIFFASS